MKKRTVSAESPGNRGLVSQQVGPGQYGAYQAYHCGDIMEISVFSVRSGGHLWLLWPIWGHPGLICQPSKDLLMGGTFIKKGTGAGNGGLL